MKRIFISLIVLLGCAASYAQSVISAGETYLKQLQPRDSILVADQLEYGMVLQQVKPGTALQLPELEKVFNDTLSLVRGWTADTLWTRAQIKALRKGAEPTPVDIRLSMVLVPWEEGKYQLPDLPVLKAEGGSVDTLLFSAQELEVKTMPLDTATFVVHDLKPQVRYPLTAQEVVPYVLGFDLFAMLVILTVCLVMMRRRKESEVKTCEPAYIVALRSLDRYRGEKFWAPDKQKTMYSGITDTLRTYIESRFGVNAEEMTTADIFDELKGCVEITPELYGDVKELFELSDFVKFAKHTASDEDNAKAIPTAVRFVTSTYQSQLDEQAQEEENEAGEEAAQS